jgi:hypothetical protein
VEPESDDKETWMWNKRTKYVSLAKIAEQVWRKTGVWDPFYPWPCSEESFHFTFISGLAKKIAYVKSFSTLRLIMQR